MLGLPSSLVVVARHQRGLLTRRQALGALSAKQIETRLRDGLLERERRGVYRLAGVARSWEQALLGACLAVPGAIASHSAAAALHRLDPAPLRQFEITVPRQHPVRLDSVTVHDSQFLGPPNRTTVLAIPSTSVARTLYDLSAVLRPWELERALDDALRRRLLTIRQLAAIADQLDGRGRRRCTVTRDILDERASGFHPGDSHPEVRIARLLVAAGLPAPVQQYRVRLGQREVRIDLCYPEQRIAIEYDGWEFHSTRSAFDRDRARANDLVVLGFQVLRFTSRSSDQTIVETVVAAHRRACAG